MNKGSILGSRRTNDKNGWNVGFITLSKFQPQERIDFFIYE